MKTLKASQALRIIATQQTNFAQKIGLHSIANRVEALEIALEDAPHMVRPHRNDLLFDEYWKWYRSYDINRFRKEG